jgi:hypothetical protein
LKAARAPRRPLRRSLGVERLDVEQRIVDRGGGAAGKIFDEEEITPLVTAT